MERHKCILGAGKQPCGSQSSARFNINVNWNRFECGTEHVCLRESRLPVQRRRDILGFPYLWLAYTPGIDARQNFISALNRAPLPTTYRLKTPTMNSPRERLPLTSPPLLDPLDYLARVQEVPRFSRPETSAGIFRISLRPPPCQLIAPTLQGIWDEN